MRQAWPKCPLILSCKTAESEKTAYEKCKLDPRQLWFGEKVGEVGNDVIQDWVEQLPHDFWFKAEVLVTKDFYFIQVVMLPNGCVNIATSLAEKFT